MRPTGEWEYAQYADTPNTGYWHCSKCRHIVLGCIEKPSFNFCPNCGRYMKGGGTVAANDLHHPGP